MSDSTQNVNSNEEEKIVTLSAFQDGVSRIVDNLIAVDVSATLEASNWTETTSGGETVWTQTENVTVPSKYKSIIVGLASTATAAQTAEAADCNISTVAFANGVLTVTATDRCPTINLPIVIQMSTVNSFYESPQYTQIDNTPIATTSVAGKVKPDGTSVAVANDGTISVDLSGKMDVVTGTQGQMIGFDASGNPEAQNVPNTGHVISDGTTTYTQRATLEFVNASITDDSTNNKTIVTVEGGGTTIVQKPTVVVDSYTYNGQAQGPTITWATGMADNCTVTNATKINAGTYTLTISLNNAAQMVWADDMTTSDLTYEYTIAKANQSIVLSSSFVTLDEDHLTTTVTVSGNEGTLNVTSSDSTVSSASISGSTVTISNVNQKSGSATITVTSASTTNYNEATATISVTCDFLKIVTFADGTDEEIKAMLDAYYANNITWAEMGWAVGNTRTIHLNAMSAPNPNSSNTWAAQDIVIAIVAHDRHDLATPINGHSKACITVQTRECMNNNTSGYNQAGHIYVNGDSSYDMTFTKWANLYMRTYLNSTVLGAIPTGDFKDAIKQISHYCHTAYNTADDELVTDTLFLPSYPEVFGTASYQYYTPTTHTEGTQWSYYETAANRIKYGNNNGASNGTAQYWWEGSASNYYASSSGCGWCSVDTSGAAGRSSGGDAFGLAPAFAM